MKRRGTILQALDLYQKIPTDLTEATTTGGYFSMVAALFMVLLFHMELFAFISSPTESYIVVDNAEATKLRINFNITMMDLPCEFLAVDALDVLGTNRMNITSHVEKWHLDQDGVRQAYQGRNREQRDIVLSDEKHQDLEILHANGVHAVPLTEETFDKWLADEDFTFVVFHVNWCIWCQRLMPTIEALAEEVEESEMGISVATVDCKTEQRLCERFSVKAYPTMMLFQGREVLPPEYQGDRTVGAFVKFLAIRVRATRQDDATSKRLMRGMDMSLNAEWPGCLVSGYLMVNRVPGNFHLEARSKSHTFHAAMTNLSHVVHHISFGEMPPRRIARKIRRLDEEHRQEAPLNGNSYLVKNPHQAPHHYLKVVGTTYKLNNMKKAWHGYQVVANSQMMYYDEKDIPEARFAYNISPMSVLIRVERRPWYDFVTQVLAIIGGTYSVVGLFDAVVFRLRKKAGWQLK
ncbi:unnamed protein product [Discosporangium mesarthrocarpum]